MGADFWRWHGFPGDNGGFSWRGEVQLGPVCHRRDNRQMRGGMQMVCLAENNRKLIRANGQPAPYGFPLFVMFSCEGPVRLKFVSCGHVSAADHLTTSPGTQQPDVSGFFREERVSLILVFSVAVVTWTACLQSDWNHSDNIFQQTHVV